MKNRFVSILLAAFFVFSAFAVSPSAATGSVNITFATPAIRATVNEKIDLTKYDVQFKDGSASVKSANITWELDGNTVTSYTPEKAGVTKLTANSGGSTKNIYVVAKNSDDTDYLLYYNDFDSEDSISDFTFSNKNKVSIDDSKLIVDAVGSEMIKVALPDWLADFGNYNITASVMMSNYADTSRWNSIFYRSNGIGYPFYHMCVRKNCSGSSGVEYAQRTTSNAWNVVTRGSYTTNQLDNTYYKYNIQILGNNVLYSINDKSILFNSDSKTLKAGHIGFIANYSKMHIDYVRVTLQTTTPKLEITDTLINTTATVDNIQNAITNVAEITSKASLSNLSDAFSAILLTDGTNILASDNSVIGKLADTFELIGENVIPIFKCETKSAADGVLSLVETMEYIDAAILSSDTTVIQYARQKNGMLRGIVDFRGKYSDILTDEDVLEIRSKTNGSNCKTALVDSRVLTKSKAEAITSLLVTLWIYTDCASVSDAAQAIVLGGNGVVTPKPDKVKEAYSLFASNTISKTPLIIGHRGNPTQAPENSMTSYAKAYENGADVIETDVYLSSDGQVVVMHDSDVSRTTDGTGNIESLTLSKLKTFHLWGENDAYKNSLPDERIPTFEEVCEFVSDKDLLIFCEIKSSKTAICQKIVDIAKKYNVTDRLVIISFSLEQCVQMHKVAPEISTGYLMNGTEAASTQLLANNAVYKAMLTVTKNNTTINPNYTNCTQNLISAAANRGLTIWPWTYSAGSGSSFCNVFRYGYNGLTTNDAQYTKNTVKYIASDVVTVNLFKTDTKQISVTSMTYGRKSTDITSKAQPVIIEGNDVISLDNGMITALKPGVAKVMFGYECSLPNSSKYTLYTEVITITVSENSEKLTFASGSVFKISEGFVKNIPSGTKVSALRSSIVNADVRFTGNSVSLEDSAVLFTGCVVTAYRNGSELDSATIVVSGDVDCDGNATNADIIEMRNGILKKSGLSRAQVLAADYDDNGELTITDYILSKLKEKRNNK